MSNTFTLSRRAFLKTGAAAGVLAALPLWLPRAEAAPSGTTLIAQPARAALRGAPRAQTPVWGYNGTVPGPLLRFRRREQLRVRLHNQLEEGSSIHWHGIRLPNAMDGVPQLTQESVAPGASFDYAFDLDDAGTFWYHPHFRAYEQKGRGLYGALIVEEDEPLEVDRELVWLLDDWRLDRHGRVSEDFGNGHDVSHAGRIGSLVTVNGQVPAPVAVARGERVRLRLINVANARVFALRFVGHSPKVIATDGHAVTPHRPEHDRIVLGPGMRADVVLEMTGEPGEAFAVHDDYYRGHAYELTRLVYGPTPRRERLLESAIALTANPLPEPNLDAAEPLELVLEGGMMGGMRAMQRMMGGGAVWTLNEQASDHRHHRRLFALERGRSYRMRIRNDTAWPHPMHLHGHVFRVVARNGVPVPHRHWRDTVLLERNEITDIAFVADNPGRWVLHCHVLEHHAGGMGGYLHVS